MHRSDRRVGSRPVPRPQSGRQRLPEEVRQSGPALRGDRTEVEFCRIRNQKVWNQDDRQRRYQCCLLFDRFHHISPCSLKFHLNSN